ncbi:MULTISPECIES: MarR family transcriptional regulator [unclassified Exiguobacterium]|uniref:MarR family winged helix-turn-helix transcriptional regulator n=1 Tax=unclassified Exiguobacterium TaxID=2644629 RepID=UPI000B587C2F|nr:MULTISPECIES: MarR family transcriptional regulator [unclassified Exiguobacterium]ASI36774.1 MarR family transcriptional regulator [Exiguobacterium sp. N4-1P]
MSDQALEVIELELAILIRRLTTATADNRNLDRASYLLLRQLSESGPVGVKTLARELQLDVSTVSRQAAALDQKKLVEKVRDEADGRAFFYHITSFGQEELTIYRTARLASIERLLTDWSGDDTEAFGRLLQQFNRELRER